MRTKTKILSIGAVLAMLTLGAVTPVLADLMIMPIRTVFKDGDRMKTITVVNTSEKKAVFRVSFRHQRQVEGGGYDANNYDPIDPNYDLSKMLVFSPRQVELPSSGKQAIRLSLRRPEGLPDGEYRVHLKLERMGDVQAPRSSVPGAVAVMGINVGFTVPVILRKGRYDASAKITNFKLIQPSLDKKNGQPFVEVALERTGKHSTLGKLTVFWTPPGGKERQVGILNGVNVFAETAKRTARVPLTEQSVSGGTFRVVFDGADADKGVLFDDRSFPG